MFKKVYVAGLLFFLYLVFTFWVYTSGTKVNSGINKMSVSAQEGKKLYQKLNCNACHQLFGLGGYLGPELTHVISQKGKGRLYVAALLKNGSAQMPDFHLDSLRANEIISFLSYVDSSAFIDFGSQASVSQFGKSSDNYLMQ